jgi:hypothetical protein
MPACRTIIQSTNFIVYISTENNSELVESQSYYLFIFYLTKGTLKAIMPLSDQNTLFKPFLTAGIIIIVFGIICIWIAGTIGLQEEGDGFRIIGWRFVVGGAISISIGLVIKNFRYIFGHLNYFWIVLVRRLKRSKHDDLFKP